MDSKKVIEKLLKIAENQQKMILKLAQGQGLPPDSLPNSQVSVSDGQAPAPPAPPPPNKLEPASPSKTPARTLIEALTPAVKQTLVNIEARGGEMLVRFHPGKATQANLDAIFNTLQKLTNNNVIMQKYTLKVV